MKCVIALDGRFVLNGGKPASHHLTYDRLWKRYLEVFDSLTVVGRLYPIEDPDSTPVEGPGLSFFPMPGYIGPFEYLQKLPELKKRVKQICAEDAAFIVRNSAIGTLVYEELRKKSVPYGIEVIADPYDAFAPGSIEHPLRPFFRWLHPRQLRQQCAEAAAATYVTQHALQQRYPASPEAYSTYFSDVRLPDTSLVDAPRSPQPATEKKLTLIGVGSLAQLYKAPNIVIDAVGICVKEGLNLELVWVGDGRYRAELEQQAKKLNLENRVNFLGQLPAGDAVREQLDRADLFLLPSYQEGLPRAMVEAMARALPCIGSTVGGFPELLASEDLVEPGNANALAQKIREVVINPERMAKMSARNLEKTKNYQEEALHERRVEFYQNLRKITADWMDTAKK